MKKKQKAWAVVDESKCYEIILNEKEVENMEKNSAGYLMMMRQGLRVVPCSIIYTIISYKRNTKVSSRGKKNEVNNI